MANREALEAGRRLRGAQDEMSGWLPPLGETGYAGSRRALLRLIEAAIKVGGVRQKNRTARAYDAERSRMGGRRG